MSTLLHIAASPRGEASKSLNLARVFLDTCRATHPDAVIESRDLWQEPLPVFDGHKAKMTVIAGGTPTGAQGTAWEAITAVFNRFNAADRHLFSVPMWNGGIPYVLKQYIDVITQPGLVFGFDPAGGYHGLLEGKRAATIYTSGVYAPGAPPAFGSDFHSTYFEDWLGFAGIFDVRSVRFQPTLRVPDLATARRVVEEQARRLATAF
jgi:FMN-dependent NADH-azoreductase